MIKVLSAFGRKALEIREVRKIYNIYISEEYWIYIESFKNAYVNLSKDRRVRIIKNEKYSFDKLTYYLEVWMHTERSLNKTKLNCVVDHIVPIIYGYRNKLPSSFIGGVINLQYLSHKDNLKKNSILTQQARELIKSIYSLRII